MSTPVTRRTRGTATRQLQVPFRPGTGRRMSFPRAALLLALLASPGRADQVFVSSERGDDVRVVSTEKDAVVAVIPVGKRPRGMCLSPDGKTVFVALGDEDAVALVDVASRAVVRKVAVGRDPEQVAVSPDGTAIYVSFNMGLFTTGEITGNRLLIINKSQALAGQALTGTQIIDDILLPNPPFQAGNRAFTLRPVEIRLFSPPPFVEAEDESSTSVGRKPANVLPAPVGAISSAERSSRAFASSAN